MTEKRSKRKHSSLRSPAFRLGFLLFALLAFLGYFIYLGWSTRPSVPETDRDAVSSGEIVTGKPDGSEPSKDSTLGTASPVEFKLFFGNEDFNSTIAGCDEVFPVFRKAENIGDPRSEAVRELLEGPSRTEVGQGYYTALNQGIRLLGLRLEGGTAYPDFSRELEENVAGSCTILAIRAQISETLLQFEDIDKVVILVDGSPGGVLQP